jgi:hypothetical protein
MKECVIEFYLTDDGQRILVYPSLSEFLEILNEIGQCEFEFTPYCG